MAKGKLVGKFTLALEHLRPLQSHQARMRKIEGHGKPQHPVRGEELLRQPHMWAGHDVARGKLALKSRDTPCHQRTFELRRQVALAVASSASSEASCRSIAELRPARRCARAVMQISRSSLASRMRGQRCG